MKISVTLECSNYVVRLGILEWATKDLDEASNVASDLGAQLGIEVVEDCDVDMFVKNGYWDKTIQKDK